MDTNWNNQRHLSEKIKRHQLSKNNLHNDVEFALLGTVNIREQLDSAYWTNICKVEVVYLSLLFEGHDEAEQADNPGIFCDIRNWASEFDKSLAKHLKNSTVFK